MVKRDFSKNPITIEELMHCRWYAIANDTIGGWDIATANVPDSRRNPYAGEYEVGCFLTQQVAEFLAKLHNEWWDAKVWDSYYDNILVGMALSASPLTEDDWFDYDDQ